KQIEQKRVYFNDRVYAEQGIRIQEGPFGISSRAALELEKYAETHGKGGAFHHAVEEAYWRYGQDISQQEVLAGLMTQAGLPSADVNSILADTQYAQAVDADVWQAQQYGLQGVPAVVVQNKYLISGAQPYPVFQQVMAKVLSEQAEG
ncbi:MAG: DsbA family protein, partial [Armatimonadetes bacterium]|nr:DsbA family protein [Anaerolineae bacterium]